MKKKIMLFLLLLIPFNVFAYMDASTSSLTITKGETKTFTVSPNGATGRIDVYPSDGSVVKVTATCDSGGAVNTNGWKCWMENGTVTFTVQALKTGTTTIYVENRDVTNTSTGLTKDDNGNELNGVKKSITVKVNEPTFTLTYVDGPGCNTKQGTLDSTWGTLCEPTKTGYTFNGWDGVSASTIVSGNITATAKWTLNKYNLNLNVGDGIDKVYYKVNGSSNYESTSSSITVPVNYNSVFYVYAVAKNGYSYTGSSAQHPIQSTMGVNGANFNAAGTLTTTTSTTKKTTTSTTKSTTSSTTRPTTTSSTTTNSITTSTTSTTTNPITTSTTTTLVENPEETTTEPIIVINNYLNELSVGGKTIPLEKNVYEYSINISNLINSVNVEASAPEGITINLTGDVDITNISDIVIPIYNEVTMVTKEYIIHLNKSDINIIDESEITCNCEECTATAPIDEDNKSLIIICVVIVCVMILGCCLFIYFDNKKNKSNLNTTGNENSDDQVIPTNTPVVNPTNVNVIPESSIEDTQNNIITNNSNDNQS